jgi:hypothetical protein
LIKGFAMKHISQVTTITSDYINLNQSAQSEIIRLNEFGKLRNSSTDNPEIYREWAYGVFLFWKKLAGDNATPTDLLSLEMLATGEQQI